MSQQFLLPTSPSGQSHGCSSPAPPKPIDQAVVENEPESANYAEPYVRCPLLHSLFFCLTTLKYIGRCENLTRLTLNQEMDSIRRRVSSPWYVYVFLYSSNNYLELNGLCVCVRPTLDGTWWTPHTHLDGSPRHYHPTTWMITTVAPYDDERGSRRSLWYV